jgi:hypothetical protein
MSMPGDIDSIHRRGKFVVLKGPTWRVSFVVPIMEAYTPAVAVSMIGVLAL